MTSVQYFQIFMDGHKLSLIALVPPGQPVYNHDSVTRDQNEKKMTLIILTRTSCLLSRMEMTKYWWLNDKIINADL